MTYTDETDTETTGPRRIQRKRTAGWRAPEGAVYVGRGTRWGNPFKATENRGRWPGHGPWLVVDNNDVDYPLPAEDTELGAAAHAVHLYGVDITSWGSGRVTVDQIRDELAGRDLMCWCPTDQSCHADVLLEIANTEGDA